MTTGRREPIDEHITAVGGVVRESRRWHATVTVSTTPAVSEALGTGSASNPATALQRAFSAAWQRTLAHRHVEGETP